MRRIGAFAVFVLLVAGCTSSADPGPPHTGSAPPSTPATTPVTTASTPSGPATPTVPADVPTTGPNTNPGEKPPLEPAAATAHTAAGAKAFAVFFIKTIDWGFATMSGAYMRHYLDARCTSCRTVAEGMDKDRRSGDRYIGGRLTITKAAMKDRPVFAGADVTAVVTFDVQSFEQVARSGKPITADPARQAEQFEVSAIWRSPGWRVVHLGLNR